MKSELTRYLPVTLVLSLRALFEGSWAPNVLTLLALSASVTLAAGLELGARAVQAQLEETTALLAGEAQLELTNGDLGIPEELLAAARAVPGVALAAPVIQETMFLTGPQNGQALRILGVDLLEDRKVRKHSGPAGHLDVRDPLQLVADPNAIIVSEVLANRLGLSHGSLLRVRRGENTRDLLVQGIVRPGGVADAYGGQLAVMDVYALQAMANRVGQFGRIDIIPKRGVAIDDLRAALEKVVAGRAAVRKPAAHTDSVQTAMSTVALAVAVLSLVGMLVAAVVCFGTMTLAVDRRVPELALLRAIGVDNGRCRRMVWSESLLMAGLGSAIGLIAATYGSSPFRQAFSLVLNQLENVEVREVHPSATTFAVGLGVGGIVALLGTVLPARRATRRPPLDVLHSARSAISEQSIAKARMVAGVAGAALCAGLGMFDGSGLSASLRVALVLLGALAWVALLGDALLRVALRVLRDLIERADPGIARLAGAGLLSRGRQTRTTLASIAAVVGGLTAILILLESVVSSLDEWQNAGLRGGVVADRPSHDSLVGDLIPSSVVAKIRSAPGVRGVYELSTAETVFRDQPLRIYAHTRQALTSFGEDRDTIGVDPMEVTRSLLAGQVTVNEPVARRFGLRPGEFIALSTPIGPQKFRITALERASSDGVGGVWMDVGTFDRFWQRDGARLLVIWFRGHAEQGIESVRAEVGPNEPLVFVYGDALLHNTRIFLARFNSVFYSLFGLTGILGGIALAALSFSSVLERQREFLLLRAAGACRAQLSRMVLCDALVLAALGVLLGVLVGLCVADPLVDAVGGSFGWTLALTIPTARVVALSIGAIAGALLVAAYPARMAARAVARVPMLVE